MQVYCLAQVTARNVRVQSTLKLHLYIRAHSYAHVQVHVHGVAHVKSDTWCGRLPAGIGGDVTDLPDHLQVQFVI